MKGHNCDNCERDLAESDYTQRGGWSYTCRNCGFKYNHSSHKSANEQVDEFNGVEESENDDDE